MRLLLFLFVLLIKSILFGQNNQSDSSECILPVNKLCISVNDNKPLFLNYSNKDYKGFVFVQGTLDISTLVFHGQKIIYADLTSKQNLKDKIELEYDAAITPEKSYLNQVLPEMKKIVQKIKFKIVRHDDCLTQTVYKFRIDFR